MNSLQFRQLAKLVEDLGKRLDAIDERLALLEAKRGPGRPKKTMEATVTNTEYPIKVNDA